MNVVVHLGADGARPAAVVDGPVVVQQLPEQMAQGELRPAERLLVRRRRGLGQKQNARTLLSHGRHTVEHWLY